LVSWLTSYNVDMTRTALHADRLFDGVTTSADPLVLLEDGRITEVRTGPPPPDAEFIDLPGATLLPGLVDTHVHLAFDGGCGPVAALAGRDDDAVLEAMAQAAAAQLRAGVTTVRDLGDRDYLTLRLRETTAGLPTIVAAGPPITSSGGHCHFLGGVAERGVRDAVREHAERGVDVIKVMASGGFLTSDSDVDGRQFTADDLVALVDEAHRHGLPVTAHAHALAAIVDGVAAGVDGLEHCSFVDGDRVVAPDDLVAAIVRRRIAVGATLGLAPTSLPVAPPVELLKILPAILANHARLIREGAVVMAGTDAGIAPVKPHGVLPRGLMQLVELGMRPAEALASGTSTAAQVCGLGDRKGRVRPGYDADLLAVDGDPLTEIGALLRPIAVYASGHPVIAAALS
jgi:imidazolonepropionase-like amidohydrolase